MNSPNLTKYQRDIHAFAFRYAVPRKTYALSLVVSEIKLNITSFQNWEINSFLGELNYYIKYFSYVETESFPTRNYKIQELQEYKTYFTNLLAQRGE